ncbi:DNA polymerase III subunit alpha [Lentibacillus cibarius]|uniref:DNA polymerase III subunit alpha n=1 Tax=Lentibacillus cibarius TaxID=2583219 RepID=A0A549YM33_9BACI|nr:DNA polymerase III subunit alpha [Lentibacillus cibarius]TRM12939.1 DNA polymerase III subunit alpha [Lentibacillus cibarius]
MSFTHLQVRSGYSFMQSTIDIDKLVEKARELQFDALALTDEHVLYGVIPFYKACKRNGIKPIIGMYVTVVYKDDNTDDCILLAKNSQGYKNLVKISTDIQNAQENGITKDRLESLSSDLICILMAMDAKTETLLLNETYDSVKEHLDTLRYMFSRGDFYLGIQDHGLDRERKLNQSVRAFQDFYEIPAVLVNDVRYLNEKDDIAYDCLRFMKSGKKWPLKITDSSVKNRYLRPKAEMDQLFGSYWANAVQATEQIVKKCDVIFDFTKRMLPSYPVPRQMDAHTYLEMICQENVQQMYDDVTAEITKRLTYELEVIQSMQFSDYFLIVWDFIAYAKKQGILVGPGRGSAAGSLVAYVLGITEIDPLENDLLFERFLNPERTSMPDIDIDFSDHRRDEVIDYVRMKYGNDHVAQIITFGTFSARSLVRELIKTIDVDRQDARFILQAIPAQAKYSIVDYVKGSKDLQEYIKQSEKLKALFAVAVKLEGIPKHLSTHAAGVVISDKPLVETVPLTVGANQTQLTQYDMNDLEAIGLLKMDFLGLRNLTLMERVLQTIRYTTGDKITLANIPRADRQTYALLQQGRTNGIFQLESKGMKQVLRQLLPTVFEDIVAVNALYRPGPMEQIPVYIERKHGREQVTYPHPDLEPILNKTYGVLIYQEQIMQIAHQIAGFSMGQADMLRRAVSKKKQQLMDEQRTAFILGCQDNGYPKQIAEEIFEWIVQFSNYGFNRSHAVAYSRISYQLAYLKAHYPVSFFAELLTAAAGQPDKVNMYRKELKTLGISLLPPSINRSFGKYAVETSDIRLGFLSVKGIGNQAIREIIQARKNGNFKSLFDFCLRVSQKVVGRQTLETLIMVGAFDELHDNRASLLASIDHALEQGELFKEFNDQSSLFQDGLHLEESYVEIEDFSVMKKLQDEKDLTGFYISSHPLKKYRRILQQHGYVSISKAKQLTGTRNLYSTAVVQAIKVIRTKRGDPMAFLTVGDETDDIEAVIFPDVYRSVNRWLSEEIIIAFSGKVESRNNQLQWIMDDIQLFEQAEWENKQSTCLFIKLTEDNGTDTLEKIRNITNEFPGNTPIIIYHEKDKTTYQLAPNYWINPADRCLKLFRDYFGINNVVLDELKNAK